jgi:hypothetical protein
MVVLDTDHPGHRGEPTVDVAFEEERVRVRSA